MLDLLQLCLGAGSGSGHVVLLRKARPVRAGHGVRCQRRYRGTRSEVVGSAGPAERSRHVVTVGGVTSQQRGRPRRVVADDHGRGRVVAWRHVDRRRLWRNIITVCRRAVAAQSSCNNNNDTLQQDLNTMYNTVTAIQKAKCGRRTVSCGVMSCL